jgi:hypothetical protein
MTENERAIFLQGYNAGRAVMFADIESGAVADAFRKTRTMSQSTIDRLILTYKL